MGAQQILLAAGGSGIDTLRLDADSVSAASTGTATAKWKIDPDGGVYWSRTDYSSGAWQRQYYWVQPAANAADYECTWEVGTGTVDTTPGAAGTWLACTTARVWEETNAVGAESASFTAKIGLAGTSTALVSNTITLEVEGGGV